MFYFLFLFFWGFYSHDVDILKYEHISPPYAAIFSQDNNSQKTDYLPKDIEKYFFDNYGNLPVMTYSDFYSLMLVLDEKGKKLKYLDEINEKSTMYIVDFEPEKYYDENNFEKAKVYKSVSCSREKCIFDDYKPIKWVFKIDAVKNFSLKNGKFEVFWNKNFFQKIPIIFEEIPGWMCGLECEEDDIEFWNFKNYDL